mgnify:CR=1 FL=1
MAEFKFIHASDLHIDSPLRGLERYEGAPVEEMRLASRRAFEGLVDLAIEEEVAFVLLAGDIFDGEWRDYNTGLYFSNQLARLAKADIPVALIRGNHDAASRWTRSLSFPKGCYQFPAKEAETLKWDELRVAVHGQSFETASVKENLARNYPPSIAGYLNIGLLHSSLDGRPGHDNYAPCTKADLDALGYQYWALGHVHELEYVSKDPWIVFPGTTQGRSIREQGEKGCVLVTAEDDEIRNLSFRPLDLARWALCEVDLEDCSREGELVDAVTESIERAVAQAQGRTLALRVVLKGATVLYDLLLDERDRFLTQIRACAGGAVGGEAWVEKVVFDCCPPLEQNAQLEGSECYEALMGRFDEICDDDEFLSGARKELDGLKSKLGACGISGQDLLDPCASEVLAAAAKRARQWIGVKIKTASSRKGDGSS